MKLSTLIFATGIAFTVFGHALSSQAVVAGSAQLPQTPDQSSRQRVRQTPRPRVAMPPAGVLVSTAQSGASRTPKPLAALSDIQVAGPDDKLMSLTMPVSKGHWLLLYRSPACVACDRLMNALAGDANPDAATVAHLTVLVGTPARAVAGSSSVPATQRANRPVTQSRQASSTVSEQHAALDGVHAKFTALDHARWAYDKTGEAYIALKPGGSPTMYGMDGTRILWRAAGSPGGNTGLQRRAAQWISSPSAGAGAEHDSAVTQP